MTRERPPFSNGMTEEEVIVHLRNSMPQPANPGGGGVSETRAHKWAEGDMILRNQLILYWITKESMSRTECVHMLMQEFRINRSKAYEWVKIALDTLNEGFEEYRDLARQIQVEKIEKSIKECKAAGKLKEAAMFTEQLNKIYGLYTENKNVEISADKPIRFEFDRD